MEKTLSYASQQTGVEHHHFPSVPGESTEAVAWQTQEL